MTAPRAGEPPMPDLTTLKAICAQATPGEWVPSFSQELVKVDANPGEIIAWIKRRGQAQEAHFQQMSNLNFIATFNPTLVARLLAVVEAAHSWYDCDVKAEEAFLNDSVEDAHAHSLLREKYKKRLQDALTALGGR